MSNNFKVDKANMADYKCSSEQNFFFALVQMYERQIIQHCFSYQLIDYSNNSINLGKKDAKTKH